MKFLREKRTLKTISFIWLIGILSSCGSYYKLKQINNHFEEKINSEVYNGSTVFFVHADKDLFQIAQPSVASNVLIAEIIPTDQAELEFYRKMSNSFTKKKRFTPQMVEESRLKNRRDQVSIDSIRLENSLLEKEPVSSKIHQVHIYTESYSKKDNQLTINTSQLFAMQIFKKALDPGLTFLISILGTAVMFIILLIIACACPHIYMDNGKESVFTNTLFTGSVSQALERFDYKTLQDFHPTSSDLHLQIRNENQEKQWTNVLGLTVAYHDPSVQVLTDVNGTLYTIQNPISGMKYTSHEGTSIQHELSKDDNSYFAFDHPTKTGLASAFVQFEKPNELDNAKLILNVKNSEWAGFVHQQFLASLGSHHEAWLSSNQKQSGKAQLAAMKKAGIPLVVSIKKDNRWVELETILAIGNANDQSLIIPIQPELLSDPSIQIRIDSGFNLWEIDYAAMDFSKPANITVEHLTPSQVSGSSSNRSALFTDDANYLVTETGSEPIDVSFEGLKTNQMRTLILESKGYYTRQYFQNGKTNWFELAKIATKYGIGKFSQDRYVKSWSGLKHAGLLNP